MEGLSRAVYPHEHITIDLSGVKKNEDCRIDCFDVSADELRALRRRGVTRIIDVTNRGMGRNIEYIQRMEESTGVEIICATGWYKEPFLPSEVENLDVFALASILIDEITVGIDGTSKKASVIGEVGTSLNEIKPLEEKIFIAAAKAHAEMGVPILTHTTLGTMGLEQIELLKANGVKPEQVVVSHVALAGDFDVMRKLVDMGANVAFDTIGKLNYQPDELRADFLKRLVDLGYTKQILMSMDITRKSQLSAFGGMGFGYLLDSFVPLLLSRGVAFETIKTIMEDNPVAIFGLK